MKKSLLAFFVLISFSSNSNPVDSLKNSDCTNTVKYYKRINQLQKEMIISQFKNDSLKNLELDSYRKNLDFYKDSISFVLLDSFNQIESKRHKEITHLKIKNLVLVLTIGCGIILYSFFQ